jgi:hypothetical protein
MRFCLRYQNSSPFQRREVGEKVGDETLQNNPIQAKNDRFRPVNEGGREKVGVWSE